ncbi:GlxA family transcriptional regulator [Hyphomicrobiales bacterium BP6-180914]|uniref:GlxA family transcriptional regulator n=2 Tax=Lichenifustis flavocetrariae TaxID=2949735 RepID=A0AA41YVC3_9HYPH|nr:GlxA family transcriptional regulator [Lichenifustis flavocetrariae]
MVTVVSALETLRLANRVCGYEAYRWRILSSDGLPVRASNGIPIPADGTFDDAAGVAAAIICADADVQKVDAHELRAKLRSLATRGIALGALGTGAYILAHARLLDGYTCTIHWEYLDTLREQFPELRLTCNLFEIDRKRLTCAGGTAGIDMMLHLISCRHGAEVVVPLIDQLVHHRIRDGQDRQRMTLRARLSVAHPKLIDVVDLMERNVEEPLSCAELAAQVAVSTRQLERLFSKYFNQSPTRFYLDIRLQRARALIRQTSISMVSVGLACGFTSASHFSKCYSERFNQTPTRERTISRFDSIDSRIA